MWQCERVCGPELSWAGSPSVLAWRGAIRHCKPICSQVLHNRPARVGPRQLLWEGLSNHSLKMPQKTTHNLSYCGDSSGRPSGCLECITDACSTVAFKGSLEAQIVLSTLDPLISQVSLGPVFSWWLYFPSSRGYTAFWAASLFLPQYSCLLFIQHSGLSWYSTSSSCGSCEF